MKNAVWFMVGALVILGIAGCKIKQKLPDNAVVLEQLLYIDEVQRGVPQTIQMPNGTVVTYKMPERLTDGDIIKIRDMPGERPYYVKVTLKERNAAK